MAEITIEGNPLKAIERALNGLSNRAAMEKYGSAIRENTRDRIKEEIDTSGRPFVYLSDVYAARKKGPGILRETGELVDSIFVEARAGEAEVGTRIDYGTWNQDGTKDGKLPQREWLSITDEDIGEIEEIAEGLWEGAF